MTRLASCVAAGRAFTAILEGDELRPLLNQAPITARTITETCAAARLSDQRLRPDEVVFLPVVTGPAKIICAGQNYASHVKETGRPSFDYPKLFTKFPDTLVGHRSPIRLPPETAEADFEAELAVVIGAPARRLAPERALGIVAGYTIANDVSLRDFQFKTDQLIQGKVWPATTPLGPWLVTPDEVGEVQDLDVRLTVNGVVMQQASTADMIWPVAELLSLISQFTPLSPGDVVLTGTPPGVGFARHPPVFMKPGDLIEVEISRLGRLTNVVEEENPDAR